MTEEESKLQESFIHLQGLKGKVINQVENLSVEAGGKGSAKKDLNTQRNLFRDIIDFFVVFQFSFTFFFLINYFLRLEDIIASGHRLHY